jgi:hypothetical protein
LLCLHFAVFFLCFTLLVSKFQVLH